MQNVWMVLVGLTAGLFSGVFGIGGGVLIVPMLVILLGFAQQRASGTSLIALLLPVGALGAWEYYKTGRIGPADIQGGVLIAAGLLVGALFGAKIAAQLPEVALRKAFSVFLVVVAVRMWPFGK